MPKNKGNPFPSQLRSCLIHDLKVAGAFSIGTLVSLGRVDCHAAVDGVFAIRDIENLFQECQHTNSQAGSLEING